MSWLPPSFIKRIGFTDEGNVAVDESPSVKDEWLPPSFKKRITAQSASPTLEAKPIQQPENKPNLWQRMMAKKKEGEGAPMIPLPENVKPLPGGREAPTITPTTVRPGQLVKSGKLVKVAGVPKGYYPISDTKKEATPLSEFEHGAIHAILPYLDEEQLAMAFPTKQSAIDFIGEFAGSTIPFAALNKISAGVKILQAIKGAPLAVNIAKGAVRGAAEMAAYSVAGELPQKKPLSEKAQAIGTNAAFGGVLGGGSEAIGALWPKKSATEAASTQLRQAAKATVDMKPSDKLNSITIKEAGERIVAGDKTVLPHIKEGVDKFGSATIEDNLINKGVLPALVKAEVKVGPARAQEGLKSLRSELNTTMEGKPANRATPLIPVSKSGIKTIEDKIIGQPLHTIKQPKIVSRVQQEAGVMENELAGGVAPELVAGGEGYFRTSSTNPEWFQNLGRNKKAVFNAIQKIKKDAGSDKGKMVEDIKALIVNRLINGIQDKNLYPSPPDEAFVKVLADTKDYEAFTKAFTLPRAKPTSGIAPSLPGRTATSMSGAIAGVEPETDENGKPTGKYKFNPAKAALGVGTMALAGNIKFEGKPGEGPKYIKQPGIRAGEEMGKQIPRELIESIKDAPWANPELINKLKTELHGIRNTNEAMLKAEMIVKNFPYQAKAMISGNKIDDDGAFIAQALIKQAQDAGNLDEAVMIAKDLARKATEGGRFVQAFTAINKLSPEGILRFAQSTIDEAMRARPNLKLSISPANAQKLVTMATEIGKMKEGNEKIFATQKLLREIYSQVPPTAGQVTATLQTMAQLLNPKTIIRNVVGNTLFGGLENINQTLVATPLDKFLSLVTGKRTTLLPSITTQAKGFVTGMKEGYKEAVEGVPAKIGTQFELSKNPIFTGNRIRDKILSGMEKTMNVVLRAPDRAAYRAAFDDSIKQQLKINGGKELTAEMIEQAHQLGLYRTFQDENAVSIVFMKLKKGLNAGKDFGLGDIILKYPKTPGNLLARSIDYSPVGIVNSIFQIGKGLQSREFNQKQFVDTFSRGITGTAGITTAAVLAKLGIITALPSKDRDVSELQRASGEGQYQVNSSALYRFVMSGFSPSATKKREGDTLVTYDWAQPVSTNMALGAKLAESKDPQKAVIDIGEVLTTGTETLAEQPLVSGVRRFFGGYKPGAAVADALQSIPASFTPTLLKQAAQVIDPTIRQTRSDEWFGLKESLNRVIAKVPFATKLLAPRIDVFGKKSKSYQPREEKGVAPQSGNLFNIFLNPAFIAKYKPNKEAQEVIRLMETTGETKQFPKYATPTILIGHGSVKLTPDQAAKYQMYLGHYGQERILALINDPNYEVLGDNEKVKEITSVLLDINRQSKDRIIAEAYWDKMKNMTNEQQKKYLEERERLDMLGINKKTGESAIYNHLLEFKKKGTGK